MGILTFWEESGSPATRGGFQGATDSRALSIPWGRPHFPRCQPIWALGLLGQTQPWGGVGVGCSVAGGHQFVYQALPSVLTATSGHLVQQAWVGLDGQSRLWLWASGGRVTTPSPLGVQPGHPHFCLHQHLVFARTDAAFNPATEASPASPQIRSSWSPS